MSGGGACGPLPCFRTNTYYYNMNTIRLIYPQWQGGDIARWIPEVEDPARAARGYYYGARVLDLLVPARQGEKVLTVPVATASGERRATDGVLDRDAIAAQTRAALGLLREARPDRIVTLGGECSVSAVPFTFLAGRYDGDLAVVWIDAHPDITLPGDPYAGYHAMAVTALMGLGDAAVVGQLPARIAPERIFMVGLRDWEREEIRRRQEEYGIAYLTPEDFREDGGALRRWLENCGASRVAVHLDLDVLDPAEIVAAVGVVPGGLRMDEAVRVVAEAAGAKELVALTVAEHMPRTALRLQAMLEQLPLLR